MKIYFHHYLLGTALLEGNYEGANKDAVQVLVE